MNKPSAVLPQDARHTFDPRYSPWPQIRKARIERLLPQAMQLAGVDAWVVICRENANDPLAMHVGGENAVVYRLPTLCLRLGSWTD